MMPATAPLGRFTQISVQVSIDATGHVSSARVLDDANGHRDNALAVTAIAAAREWRFQPATLDGDPVPTEYTIVFAFRPQLP